MNTVSRLTNRGDGKGTTGFTTVSGPKTVTPQGRPRFQTDKPRRWQRNNRVHYSFRAENCDTAKLTGFNTVFRVENCDIARLTTVSRLTNRGDGKGTTGFTIVSGPKTVTPQS